MQIALCQISTVVGDLPGNRARIVEAATQAAAQGAQLAIFPELTLTGYPPRDLLDLPAFVAAATESLGPLAAELGQAAPGLAVLVGYVERSEGTGRKPLYNAAALLQEGEVRQRWRKTLLPTYDVFDEARWFEAGTPGPVIEIAGRRVGVSICEDIWNDADFWEERLYATDPVDALVAGGASLIVNMAASPFSRGKPELRERMFCRVAQDNGVPVLSVNLVGGNDSLIFDGHSVAIDSAGQVIARAPGFAPAMRVVDLDAGGEITPFQPEEAQILEALTVGVRDYMQRCGFQRAVLGLSGGIDSALTCAIAARAVGAENVSALAMPSPYSSEGSVTDALALAENLGVRCDVVPIGEVYRAFLGALGPVTEGTLDEAAPDLMMENLQARARGTLLMARSNREGAILLTTGNKSEVAMGYCTLYGDMAGGLAVISDVPKTLVYGLCRYLNREREVIPEATISKPPSAELRPDQKDEDSLPSYELLDAILAQYVDERRSVREIVVAGHDEALVRRVIRAVDLNEYKRRQAAPGLRVTSKAFGEGRRLPIAQRFRHP